MAGIYKPRHGARGSRKAKQIVRQKAEVGALRIRGAIDDPKEVHERVQSEAIQHPITGELVHPQNWVKHHEMYYDGNVIPMHTLKDGLLPTAAIRMDGGTQSRETIYKETVNEYAEAMKNGDTLPPVDVYYDGIEYWLGDGFHRVLAAKQLALTYIAVNVHQGTRRDAILHAVGANATHGLRRTNEDKHRAVMRLLKDKEWSQWSNREIARACRVSSRFVDKLRNDASANGSQIPTKRIVRRGGTTYTQETQNIGKTTPTIAPDPISPLPAAQPVPAPLTQYGVVYALTTSEHFQDAGILWELTTLAQSNADKDAILFVWCGNTELQKALKVITGCGFIYRTNMVWLRDASHHETLIIATRGNIQPPGSDVGSIIDSPAGASGKPDSVYQLIERLYIGVPYLALFTSEARQGWDRKG